MRKVIALAANYGYLDKAETTLKSIFKHTPKAEVYLANMDIPQEWFFAVNEKLAPVGSKLYDLKIDLTKLKVGKISNNHINDYSYVRIYLPRLIEAERILYLDSDIIVSGDLTPFLELEIDEKKAIAMVKDIYSMEEFNSGVMLIDNVNWRKYQLEEACIDFIQQEDMKINNGDQTIINIACQEYIQEIPSYYNDQVGYDMFASQNNLSEMINKFTLKEALVYHYLTADKPWNLLSFNRYRSLWWAYRNLDWCQVVSETKVETNQTNRPQILIFTQTDQLGPIEQLVTAIPEADFIIAAFTEVSNKVKRLLQYPNVRVHYATTMRRLLETAQTAKLFLDLSDPINEGVQAQLQALAKPYLALKRPGYAVKEGIVSIDTATDMINYIQILLKG